MLECKQSQIQQFFQIQGQTTPDVLFQFVSKSNLFETLWAYILWPSLAMICRYESVNKVKCGKFFNSRADNSDSSGLIRSIIKLIRDLMVTYILTKFGADWLIFVTECKQSQIQQFFQIYGQIILDVLDQFDP